MIIKAPNRIDIDPRKKTIFLAGSIEMGVAENWQDLVEKQLLCKYNLLNPRREDWDSSWTQKYNDIVFRDQVIWEQTAIKVADLIIFYFEPETKSPITLLELGLCLGLNKDCLVCCPDGFWRKGNIEVMCHLYGVPLYNSLTGLLEVLQTMDLSL